MKNKNLLIIMLLLWPLMVFAGTDDSALPLGAALFIEAFVTIHMSVFVLKPLSMIFSKENDKKIFWTLFIIRIVVLLFCDIFVTTAIAMIDVIGIFVGAFFVIPISASITKTPLNKKSNQVFVSSSNGVNTNYVKVITPDTITAAALGVILKCVKCSTIVKENYKFCPNCGSVLEENNISVEKDPNFVPKKVVKNTDFDQMYGLSDEAMLEAFIEKQLIRYNIDKNAKLIPTSLLKKKKKLNAIFLFLLFAFVSMIFFHFPIFTYIIGIIILIIFYKLTNKYNLIKYLKKEIEARPSEKISNIVINVKNTFVIDDTKKSFLGGLCLAIVLPMIIFVNPRIMYEEQDNGYAVRFYTFGVTNFTTATIPSSHNGKPVVSLRGNAFSNMFFLKKVSLPDTITEIRGRAFKNDFKLTDVNIPKKLEYLGGGSFYNCMSLKSIELPDTLTYMGGETFNGATSLKNVNLSENLTEIRGNTFEYCSSLEEITIPDKVTRIGGHAFYGASSLHKVNISRKSQLKEIGSSAFRMCSNLYDIELPQGIYVNERAFKESPTRIIYFSKEEYTESYFIDNGYSSTERNKPNLIGYNPEPFFTALMTTGEKLSIASNSNISGFDTTILLNSIYKQTNNNDDYNFYFSDGTTQSYFSLSKFRPYVTVSGKYMVYMSYYNSSSAYINIYKAL